MATDQKTWYRLELCYHLDGEVKKFEYINCDRELVRILRFRLLDEGVEIPLSLSQSIIIFPSAIRHIMVWRQDRFFGNLHSDLTKTVFDGSKKKV